MLPVLSQELFLIRAPSLFHTGFTSWDRHIIGPSGIQRRELRVKGWRHVATPSRALKLDRCGDKSDGHPR